MKTRTWHLVQISTLGLAGLLALLVGIARVPALEALLPKSYFQTALVGHVDLFLVVWYVIIPVLFLKNKNLIPEKSERLTFGLMGLGTLGIVISSIFALGQPVMANYVPFIVNPIFVGGFFAFMGGIAVATTEARRNTNKLSPLIKNSISSATLCYLGTTLSLIFIGVKIVFEGEALFSHQSLTRLFWFTGHILQFAHVSFMLLIWAEFLSDLGVSEKELTPLHKLIQQLPIGVFLGLLTVFFRTSEELLTTKLLTDLKSYGIGIPTAIAAAYTLWIMFSAKLRGPGQFRLATLISALALLILGGVIAIAANMQVQTTLIPAHYHAVLTAVGVTFMGYTYALLEKEKIQLPSPRFATLQPYLYGFGTFALAAGMAWAGLHNAPRKTPGISYIQSGDINLILSLYMWGAGVILSVLGGFAYLINVGLSCLRWREKK